MNIATAPVNWNNNDVRDYREWTSYPQLLEEMLAAGYTATEWDVCMEKEPARVRADLQTRDLRMLGRFVGLELRNPEKRASEIERGLEISRFLINTRTGWSLNKTRHRSIRQKTRRRTGFTWNNC